MMKRAVIRRAAAMAPLAVLVSLLVAPGASAAVKPLSLGLDEPMLADAQKSASVADRIKAAGADHVRIGGGWASVAPGGASKPSGFDARNPADPAYKWAAVDRAVIAAAARGLTPYLLIHGAPQWARQGTPPSSANAGGGAWKPNAADFADFAHAAATRFSGTFVDPTAGGLPLPRVRIFQAWNEPTLPLFLAPTSVELYRSLLNAMYDAVKAVQPDAIVVSAGLAPVKSSEQAAFPKRFAEDLLCIKPSNGTFAKRPCPVKAKFDAFSVHPYSLKATPNQRAQVDGNMFVADVIDFRKMLDRATKLKTVAGRRKPLWVTEFAWFTNPPNRNVGDDPAVAGDRASIAIHKLWRAGVESVTWYLLDDSSGGIIKGGGLFAADGRSKPTAAAFAFPFYAEQRKRRAYIWGIAPQGAGQRVLVQRRARGQRFRTVARIKPRADGMFVLRFRTRSSRPSEYVARQGSAASVSVDSRDAFK